MSPIDKEGLTHHIDSFRHGNSGRLATAEICELTNIDLWQGRKYHSGPVGHPANDKWARTWAEILILASQSFVEHV